MRLYYTSATKGSDSSFDLANQFCDKDKRFNLLRQRNFLFSVYGLNKDFMLEPAIFLPLHLQWSYRQLIYLTILASLCSSYSLSEIATISL